MDVGYATHAAFDGEPPNRRRVGIARPRRPERKSRGKILGPVGRRAALVAIVVMPQPAGLSVAGQHMLGIFAFAVIVWMTEAVDYAASSDHADGADRLLARHRARSGASRSPAGHERRRFRRRWTALPIRPWR